MTPLYESCRTADENILLRKFCERRTPQIPENISARVSIVRNPYNPTGPRNWVALSLLFSNSSFYQTHVEAADGSELLSVREYNYKLKFN